MLLTLREDFKQGEGTGRKKEKHRSKPFLMAAQIAAEKKEKDHPRNDTLSFEGKGGRDLAKGRGGGEKHRYFTSCKRRKNEKGGTDLNLNPRSVQKKMGKNRARFVAIPRKRPRLFRGAVIQHSN